ncbi:hypothetical protein RRG08_058696 [Elysia crispata]|uniref:Uncharacterized protein n=1 Tax=Elysia crispata TaxID=231223 RepID=A0AAE0YXM9_9GAST|nr:hypothetical protein RRG08_058696 [Elysia crispata]
MNDTFRDVTILSCLPKVALCREYQVTDASALGAHSSNNDLCLCDPDVRHPQRCLDTAAGHLQYQSETRQVYLGLEVFNSCDLRVTKHWSEITVDLLERLRLRRRPCFPANGAGPGLGRTEELECRIHRAREKVSVGGAPRLLGLWSGSRPVKRSWLYVPRDRSADQLVRPAREAPPP